MRIMEKEYTLYKGNEVIAEGTIREIAQQTGLKEATIRSYGSPSYQKIAKNDRNHRELVPLDKYTLGRDNDGRE